MVPSMPAECEKLIRNVFPACQIACQKLNMPDNYNIIKGPGKPILFLVK